MPNDEWEELYERLSVLNQQAPDSFVESVWQQWDATITEPFWGGQAAAKSDRQDKLMAVWQAIDALCQTTVRDIRYWLAYQIYTWAVAQLNELELAVDDEQESDFADASTVVIIDPPYTVVNEVLTSARQATSQLSFW